MPIILCVICILGLTACGNTDVSETDVSGKYANLDVVERSSGQCILVDKDTGVLYLWYKDNSCYGQSIIPLYNADGTLKNINDFEKDKNYE